MCETISTKVRNMSNKVSDLIGDHEVLEDFDNDKDRFDEALAVFRMLRALSNSQSY